MTVSNIATSTIEDGAVRFPLFSVDDHIVEHARVWTDRVPSKYRDLAPHVIEEGDRELWVYEDVKFDQLGLNAVAGKSRDEYNPDPIRFSDMIPGCYDPAERVKDLRKDGIVASLCFPTLPRFGGARFLEFKDKQLADLCVRAYNDFVLDEWCGAAPRMFPPMTITQLWDPRLAAAEVRRCAGKGARAISFPENPVPLGLPSFFTDHWDPFFDAVVETDLVVCVHIGSSGFLIDPSPDSNRDGLSPLIIALCPLQSWTAAVNFAMSRIPRRFPQVKVALSEGGIGWIAAAKESADRQWERHKFYVGWDDTLPSEVFDRNLYYCTLGEPVGIESRYHIGVDRIMWECDYPHVDTSWPNSQKEVSETLGRLPREEFEMVTLTNAARIFRWEPDLDQFAGQVAP